MVGRPAENFPDGRADRARIVAQTGANVARAPEATPSAVFQHITLGQINLPGCLPAFTVRIRP
jgi:hypothetical protein